MIVSQTVFLSLCMMTLTFWCLFPFYLDEFKFPIAASYPFPIDNNIVISLVFIYQVLGIIESALYNVLIDSIAVGTIVMMTAQVQRLSLMISNIGRSRNEYQIDNKDHEFIEMEKKLTEIESEKNENYAEIVRCLFLHRKIFE